MNTKQKQYFDFSLDAMAFKEHLAHQLHLKQHGIELLQDDDLEFVNAAGTPNPIPNEDDLP